MEGPRLERRMGRFCGEGERLGLGFREKGCWREAKGMDSDWGGRERLEKAERRKGREPVEVARDSCSWSSGDDDDEDDEEPIIVLIDC